MRIRALKSHACYGNTIPNIFGKGIYDTQVCIPINEKGDEMPIYVVLGNFTQKRIETIKNLPEGIKESRKVFESFGVKVKALVFTLGRYDV